MNIDANKKYIITYISNKGKECNLTFTPKYDMNKAQLINYLKTSDNNFFKLLDAKLYNDNGKDKKQERFNSNKDDNYVILYKK